MAGRGHGAGEGYVQSSQKNKDVNTYHRRHRDGNASRFWTAKESSFGHVAGGGLAREGEGEAGGRGRGRYVWNGAGRNPTTRGTWSKERDRAYGCARWTEDA